MDPQKTTERIAGMISVGSVHPYAMSIRSCHSPEHVHVITGRGKEEGGWNWRRACGEVGF